MIAESWWSTAGALILLTGIVAVSSTLVTLLLRPWSANRIRNAKRQERTQDAWINEAQQMSVELEGLLIKYRVDILFSQATSITMTSWEVGGLRTRAALVLRFGPTNELKQAGIDLLNAIDMLHRHAESLLITKRDKPHKLDEVREDYGRFLGEAVYALNRFTEAVGGPATPAREAFPLPLKDDR